MKTQTKRRARDNRHRRLRRKIRGTAERPRLAVYRSNTAIYAQVIDDTRGHTLVAASSIEADLPAVDDDNLTGKSARAAAVGKLVAERAKAAGIGQVVFDRGGNQYQGRVRALAEAARGGGLAF
jgi:large subunit ribosomal protein L18